MSVEAHERHLILSVDLASRRYRDNGIALLSRNDSRADVELIRPATLGLAGEPSVSEFANALLDLAEKRTVRLLILDGPQGWKGTASSLVHSRSCERLTFTPGKTGEYGQVKPRSWTRMAQFSIALFDALDAGGWPRLSDRWQGERVAMESFPTRAWRSLGHSSLPGKAKWVDLASWRELLEVRYLSAALDDPSHDELQAVVAGLAGLQMLEGGFAACEAQGVEPYVEEGVWREGYIVSPRPSIPGFAAPIPQCSVAANGKPQ